MLLKLQKPYMYGPAVKRIQEFCDLLGYDGGINDGVYGPDTAGAIKRLQKKSGLVVDGICGPITWGAIETRIQLLMAVEGGFFEEEGILIDRRGMHKRPRLYEHHGDWLDIVGVTLHQTGCRMPNATGGWDRLNAHIGITQGGRCIIVNDPTDMIWHANGLSRHTIGIEIEGNFAGLDGVGDTLWKPGGGPHHLNSNMLKALEAVFEWLSNMFKVNSQKWTQIRAHRESSVMRQADPGQEIWEKVALPWAEKLGITAGGDNTMGTGRLIPKRWDNNRAGRY